MQKSESLTVPGLFGERPTQPPMLQRLAPLVGTWVGSGDYFDGVQTYPDRKAVHTYEWTCAGLVLVWKILSHGPLKFYQSHCAVTWNERSMCYQGSYYDNLGTNDTLEMYQEGDNVLRMAFCTGFAFLGPQVKKLQNVITTHQDGTQLWQVQADRGEGWESIITQRAYKLF